MSRMKWRVVVTWPTMIAANIEQLDKLTQALPGFGIVTVHGNDFQRVEMTVVADTKQQARKEALRAAQQAYEVALDVDSTAVSMRVLTVKSAEDTPAIVDSSDAEKVKYWWQYDDVDAQREYWKKKAKVIDDAYENEQEIRRALSSEMFGAFSYPNLTIGQRQVLEVEYERRRVIEKERLAREQR
jgi:hypothetical protein